MKLIQDMTHRVFNILEKEEVDKMMNIGLKQDKCDDSISVDEAFEQLKEDFQSYTLIRKTSKR